MDHQAKHAFWGVEYEGIVMDLRYIEGKAGWPEVKIKRRWIYLGVFAANIAFKVQIGDSIVKKKGQVEIEVYRRDSAGEWKKLVF
ncbi:MAG: hypothetical protein DRJ10_02660 [Bacteroidetes bacterium]|nr:MAG: hypothetical protein DRJ10_02660 [Bacteroidota bacterium]